MKSAPKFQPFVLTAIASLALFAAVGVSALAQDQGPPAPGQEGKGRHGATADGERGRRPGRGMRDRIRGRMEGRMDRRQGRGDLLASQNITDDQRRVFVEKARAAQPVVEQARRELAAARVAIEDARTAYRAAHTDGKGKTGEARTTDPAERAALREKLKAERAAIMAPVKAARERALAGLAPLAADVIATLTPEQRARLEGFATARGGKLDDQKLTKLVSRLFARPMAIAMAEARIGRTK